MQETSNPVDLMNVLIKFYCGGSSSVLHCIINVDGKYQHYALKLAKILLEL